MLTLKVISTIIRENQGVDILLLSMEVLAEVGHCSNNTSAHIFVALRTRIKG